MSTIVHQNECVANISQKEAKQLKFEDSLWKDCAFKNIEYEGAMMGGSRFLNCEFDEVDLYWCHAFQSIFVDCRFRKCDLRGSFDEAIFYRSTFESCETGDDNLGGKTEWFDAHQLDCKLNGTILPIVSGRRPI